MLNVFISKVNSALRGNKTLDIENAVFKGFFGDVTVKERKGEYILSESDGILFLSKSEESKMRLLADIVGIYRCEALPTYWMIKTGDVIVLIPILNKNERTLLEYSLFKKDIKTLKHKEELVPIDDVGVEVDLNTIKGSLRCTDVRYNLESNVTLITPYISTLVIDGDVSIPKSIAYRDYIDTESFPYALRTNTFILASDNDTHLYKYLKNQMKSQHN